MEDYSRECAIILISNSALIEKVDVNKFYRKESAWGIEWNCNREPGRENNRKLPKVLGISNMLPHFKVLACSFTLLSSCNMHRVLFHANYLTSSILKILSIVQKLNFHLAPKTLNVFFSKALSIQLVLLGEKRFVVFWAQRKR